ncbi:hypothetical protein F442_07643 [Phytophthora nicotianae P10297]|uniref:Uncharacterized protein n=2 Tax=Phytophthora nicotianae TaxID=4792 RepID=V9E8I1_PHYNI|nr:hypothetical protein F443_18294 [Phytophthora nicotianae P1569]ETP46058.1 hypothetical protein F442_07643 [Phytophthora nicotianae P10297]
MDTLEAARTTVIGSTNPSSLDGTKSSWKLSKSDAVDDNGEWLKYRQPATDLYGHLYWASGTDSTDDPKAEPGGDSGTCNGERKCSAICVGERIRTLGRVLVSAWTDLDGTIVCPRHTNWTNWTVATEACDGERW